MSIHMRVIQGSGLIADLPEWDGPVPRIGEYIFHPPYGPSPESIAGCVKAVTWRLYDRPADPGYTSFTQTTRPYAEISI